MFLSEPDRKRALAHFTAIEPGQNGSFEVVPYDRHYKDVLTEAAGALREAAALTHQATLRNYLTLRAQALCGASVNLLFAIAAPNRRKAVPFATARTSTMWICSDPLS